MKRTFSAAAAAALALLACAGTGERTTTEAPRARTAGGQPLEQLTRNAEWKAGRLTGITDDELRLEVYGPDDADETRLELSQAEVPVFAAGERVGRDALREGEEVRVFYEAGRGANPRVIAVEVLTEEEAAKLREPL